MLPNTYCCMPVKSVTVCRSAPARVEVTDAASQSPGWLTPVRPLEGTLNSLLRCHLQQRGGCAGQPSHRILGRCQDEDHLFHFTDDDGEAQGASQLEKPEMGSWLNPPISILLSPTPTLQEIHSMSSLKSGHKGKATRGEDNSNQVLAVG